ncbi:5,10-methenyltetrahydrofolate synthetase (5-formyltetrahydrofolate cyclo-ligase) [Centropristis striata]|uniref:5,10-methenyltetrahydrofolate synthetase (5-formyltetrahydrofolate cyclo-ligase) n=1 Tax=Centropristis striata TaxID=184440 RepID=UPI0027E1C9D2|nr:5,10-methenyltetrahydrofolate synthetase (5-formyltetrahydrofolate cyclo-ligase) [Centropristis striata]
MSAVRAAKQALRREVKQRLSSLSEEEKLLQSLRLSQRLLSHPRYEASRRLALFLSMRDEVRTEEILRDALQRGKSCFIPRYEAGGGNRMDMLQLRSLQEVQSLPTTSWSIRQPAEEDHSREEALSAGGLDLILMPGLGFDRSGRRLGRGKGFYDAYLERCTKHPAGKPYTIALAFREQMCPEVPVDHNDVLIDEVLYEE